MTLSEFVELKFEPQYVSRRRAAGKKHWRYLLDRHILPTLGSLPLADIAPDQIEDLIAAKQERYSRKTLHHIKFALSGIFERARYLRLYSASNPACGVELPPETPRRRPTYTCAQLMEVLERLKSPVYEMALLSVATSLGPAELCGIRMRHTNFTAEIAEVDGEILAPYSIAIRENWYLGEHGALKTGWRKRNAPLTADLAGRLAALNPPGDPDAPLFRGRTGRPVDTHNVARRVFRPLGRELGYYVGWYPFRRAHSSMAAITAAGLDDRKLVMGHANDRMTRYYDIADMERLRAVPKRILERLNQQGKAG